MNFYTVSTKQIVIFSVVTSLLTVALIEINSVLKNYFVLPEVHVNAKDNSCIKVVNYENGHAFNCQDVDVVLRKYRKITE